MIKNIILCIFGCIITAFTFFYSTIALGVIVSILVVTLFLSLWGQDAIVTKVKQYPISAIISVIALYTTVIVLIAISHEDFYNDSKTLTLPDGFIASFYASAFQDLIFYLLITLTTAFVIKYIKVKDPLDYNFIEKILHMFPLIKDDEIQKDYITHKMNILSCEIIQTEKTIVYQECDEEFLKILTNTNSIYRNIHHNYNVTEKIGSLGVAPDTSVIEKFKGSHWGELHHVTFVGNDPSKTSEIPYKKFTGKSYSDEYYINLKAGKQGRLTTNYWFWMDMKNEGRTTPSFFTKEYIIFLKNETQCTLEFVVKSNTNDDVTFSLKPGEDWKSKPFKDLVPDKDEISIKITNTDELKKAHKCASAKTDTDKNDPAGTETIVENPPVPDNVTVEVDTTIKINDDSKGGTNPKTK